MSMKQIEKNVFIPMPMCVVGSMVNGKPNYMAVGWVARVNANPPMIGVGLGNHHFTTDLIKASGAFSVNIIGKELLVETDFVGLVSGKNTDKSAVFKTFYGENKGAPLIEGSIVSLECRVHESVVLPANTLFVGEITAAWGEESLLAGKAPDYVKGGAFFLTMPDNQYWGFGENLGKAWSIGNTMK